MLEYIKGDDEIIVGPSFRVDISSRSLKHI